MIIKQIPEKLKAYMQEVLPEYDKEKVYVSDIRKLVHWYNILHTLNLLVKEEPEKPAEESETEKAEAVKEEKPKKEPSLKKEKASGEKE